MQVPDERHLRSSTIAENPQHGSRFRGSRLIREGLGLSGTDPIDYAAPAVAAARLDATEGISLRRWEKAHDFEWRRSHVFDRASAGESDTRRTPARFPSRRSRY